MTTFEIVLLFVKAPRQGESNLKLSSLGSFVKFFFVPDQVNYARLIPMYIASMLELQGKDQDSWEHLKIISVLTKVVSHLLR